MSHVLITYAIQRWSEDFGHWSSVEFKHSWNEAMDRWDSLRELNPDKVYRILRRTITDEEIKIPLG